jgi:uncharacterized protein YyaL (SSP411 family)
MPDSHTNRLAAESSPYLLQHAHNPVDWRPWGEEAFAEARRRGVPIFLSVGYSTCYWCHVMERESFESEAIARLMNERFVCVKVDREERPDVDDLYMAATQIMTGRGGWPMSCFLEPDTLRPFWCGTYFPPSSRHGTPGFPQILEGISSAWRDKRGEIVEQSGQVAAAVTEQMAAARAPVGVGLEQVGQAARALLTSFDRVNGGFGGAPKFPQPVFLELLLDVRDSAGDDATRDAVDQAVRLTLDRMACGGINDQIGGGFHRYSVDATWTVPHFEKMLYDNAQLAAVYARAAATYDDGFYREVAGRTLDYVRREMSGPEGELYSAQDAEVDGREGGNYVWQPDEVRAALGAGDAGLALKIYGLDGGPNFKDPHHAESPPAYVLRLSGRPEKIVAELGMSAQTLRERMDRINARLYEVRKGREQPRLDDKVLTSWSGLMIGALARAGLALKRREYVEAAARAADFVFARMRDGAGDLVRSWRAGRQGPAAVLEDYAFLVDGLLALRAADAATGWLRGGLSATAALVQARGLTERAASLFGDGEGGFFDTRANRTDLFVRARSTHDGALPSGVSVMLNNLIELHEGTGERRYLDDAVACLRSISAAVAESPIGTTNATRALLRMIGTESAVAERLAALGPARNAATPEETTPVEIYASEERIRVGKGAPAELRLSVRIKDGYHLTAADPGPGGKGLVPLRVHTINGTGIATYADYPAGAPNGAAGELLIYRGTIEFAVAVERDGEWSGRPLLAVTYQACTDRECLIPTTVELDVAVDRGD